MKKRILSKNVLLSVLCMFCAVSLLFCGITSVSAKGPSYSYYDLGLYDTNKTIKLGKGETYFIQYWANGHDGYVCGATAFDSNVGGDCARIYNVRNAPKDLRPNMTCSKGSFHIQGVRVGTNDRIGLISNKYLKNINLKDVINGKKNPKQAWYYSVNVYNAPKSVKLSKTSLTLKKGQTYTISESTNKGSYANAENLRWSSSNTRVATVAKGNANKATIKAVKKGTAYITIKTYNGKTASCKVTVK